MPRKDTGEPYYRISIDEAAEMYGEEDTVVIDVRREDGHGAEHPEKHNNCAHHCLLYNGSVRQSVTFNPPCATGGPGGKKGRPVALANPPSLVTRPTRQPRISRLSTSPKAA